MESLWPILFMLIVLKIPVIGMIWLLYWAAQEPEVETAEDDGGNDGPGRRRPMPGFPRGPRRNPHGGGANPLADSPHEGRVRQPEPARTLDRSRSRDIVRK
ncbi:MAG: hypothetical protein IPK93_06215 [Solirubrobacterales bacterium]|nr:hypothetical protein [Solirubrobacterales bacterium]